MLNLRTICGPQSAVVLVGMTLFGGGQAVGQNLINSNTTIHSSLCVGTDCATTESYGFDTIRLKENNLRIHFDDTSNSASFPKNDWRIVINDNNNGGASYFAIEDATAGRQVFRVDAGAPANSLHVSSAGNVGIGTSAPGSIELNILDGDTPTVRLAQDGSSGFQAQTWDVAGNETNFFVRDVTNGSLLPFRILPASRPNGIVARGENVGFGTADPAATLHATSSGGTTLRLDSTGGSGTQWGISANGNTGRLTIQDLVSGNNIVRIMSGAPSNSLEITGTSVRLGQYSNCGSLSTNNNGFLQCEPAQQTPTRTATAAVAGLGLAAHTHTNATTAAARYGSIVASATGDSAAGSSDRTQGEATAGCSAGDLEGDWSLIGAGTQEYGDNSVMWCDLRLTNGRALTYRVSGVCRNHEPNGSGTQTSELVAQGTVIESATCQFGGNLKIKRGKTVVAQATIIEGRIEARGGKKTRAVGLSRATRGRVRALQTLVMQR